MMMTKQMMMTMMMQRTMMRTKPTTTTMTARKRQMAMKVMQLISSVTYWRMKKRHLNQNRQRPQLLP